MKDEFIRIKSHYSNIKIVNNSSTIPDNLLQLVEQSDRPDGILKINNHLIGIEHFTVSLNHTTRKGDISRVGGLSNIIREIFYKPSIEKLVNNLNKCVQKHSKHFAGYIDTLNTIDNSSNKQLAIFVEDTSMYSLIYNNEDKCIMPYEIYEIISIFNDLNSISFLFYLLQHDSTHILYIDDIDNLRNKASQLVKKDSCHMALSQQSKIYLDKFCCYLEKILGQVNDGAKITDEVLVIKSDDTSSQK